MSDAVAATRTRLLAVSGVTNIVGTRVYFGNLPQNSTLPAVVLELASSNVADRHLSATGSLYESDLHLYCYADTHTVAASLGDAVYAALEFETGTWGSVTVKRCFVNNTHDLTEPPRDGSDAFRRIRALFCTVWHS